MEVDKELGLTSEQVQERVKLGLYNYNNAPKTKTVKEIIKDNFFTYFNYLNLALGLAVIIASIINQDILNGFKNCLFMGVIIINSIISIVEEIISKRIIDKLSMLTESRVAVVRDGIVKEVSLEEIVLDDIVKLSLGHQIVADAVILDGEIEVNECLITGESDAIYKKAGDELLSGSFIVSGSATAKVVHVGKDNYVSKITSEAKYKKDVNSVVMDSFTKMLKILSGMIIPIGIIMLVSQYRITGDFGESIFTTVASLIGMIPEGLVLLTSSVMAVGVIKLYRVKVLVQQLYGIEILARVDTICLDKTGTLTSGDMVVKEILPQKGYTKDSALKYLKQYTLLNKDTNQTMMALKNYFKDEELDITYLDKIDFSSSRKFSALEFDKYSLYLGAPEVLCKNNLSAEVESLMNDYRVLTLSYKKGKIDKTPYDTEIICHILIEDVIRPSAKDTLDYFKENSVLVKIISGDNLKTVMSISDKVGLKDIKGIDIGNLSDEELEKVIDDYDIFARAKPEQKRVIVRYLKKQGHIVAMTGDGANDVLALKESDCAISVKSGSDAARNVSQLILLNDDFNSLPNVVREGRQTINNVERSASLLLVKTLYTIMLIIYSILSFQKYFFIPIQLTFITAFTIGAPSFILALEPNNELVKGNFLFKVFSKSLPTALTVVFNIVMVSLFAKLFDIPYETQSSICVILTTIVGLYNLFKICYPLNPYRGALFFTMLFGFIFCLLNIPEFFNIERVNDVILLLTFVLTINSFYIYKLLNFLISKLFNKFDKTVKVENNIYTIR